jgi:hypothetical protein
MRTMTLPYYWARTAPRVPRTQPLPPLVSRTIREADPPLYDWRAPAIWLGAALTSWLLFGLVVMSAAAVVRAWPW